MNIILYKNKAPKNKVDKSRDLSNSTTFDNIRFIEENSLDIVSPSVCLDYTNDVEDLAQFNYARIPKLNRYYYIVNIKADGKIVRFDLKSDVLMSFKADILSSTQYILRSEKLQSPYLVDSQIPIRSDKIYHQTVFGEEVDNKSCAYIVLETTGKGGVIV